VARFYFHFANGETILDNIGTDLADLDAVRKEALGTTRDLLFEAPPQIWAGKPCRIWVTDEPNALGQTVLTLELCAR
jgi:hypothetical protein